MAAKGPAKYHSDILEAVREFAKVYTDVYDLAVQANSDTWDTSKTKSEIANAITRIQIASTLWGLSHFRNHTLDYLDKMCDYMNDQILQASESNSIAEITGARDMSKIIRKTIASLDIEALCDTLIAENIKSDETGT